MSKLTKKQKESISKLDKSRLYSVEEASRLIKQINYANFDASVDISVNLGVDPKKANQMIRGVVSLPHGTGKDVKVLALVTKDKEIEAKEAGADYVGLEEYLDKIKNGWIDMDVIVTMPSIMMRLGPLGKILGPRGLMPNPKTGTVTMDIKKSILDIKSGKIDFKVDKYGIIHVALGRISFESNKIVDNIAELISVLVKLKPVSLKGVYFKSVYLSSTQSPSIPIDLKSLKI